MDVGREATGWVGSVADRLGITPWSLVVGAIAVGAAALAGWWALSSPAPPAPDQVLPRVDSAPPIAAAETTTSTIAATVVVVHVDGAVRRPGVHELAADARVADAIDAAGGLRADADGVRLNLAAALQDGQRVWVPIVGESEPAIVGPTGGGETTDPPESSGPVDLNTADVTLLETLPGIGPTIAAAIVRHRETAGPFGGVDDLLEVTGIGPAKLEQLRGLVLP